MNYSYIFNPDGNYDDGLLSTMQYSDYECGELESLSKQLENTQIVLSNLIIKLEQKVLNKNDVKDIGGRIK